MAATTKALQYIEAADALYVEAHNAYRAVIAVPTFTQAQAVEAQAVLLKAIRAQRLAREAAEV